MLLFPCLFLSREPLSVVVRARRIIGRDAVGRNAGAFVYGTSASASLSLSFSLFLPFPTIYLFLPSLLSFFGSTDAQIKGDSGRAESPFRMKRPRLLLFPFFSFSSFSSFRAWLASGTVPVINGIGNEVLLKCAVIARHKYPLHLAQDTLCN